MGSTEIGAYALGVTGLLTGIGGLYAVVSERRGKRKKQDDETDDARTKTTADGWKEICANLTTRATASEADARQARAELARVNVILARLYEWGLSVQEACAGAKPPIQIRKMLNAMDGLAVGPAPPGGDEL